MDQGAKRKADDGPGSSEKRTKTKKQWRVPRGNHHGALTPRAIMPGDTGIFATCNKGREKKCVGELRDLFTEYADQLYGNAGDDDDDEDGGVEDIEKGIAAEIAGIQKPPKAQLFVPVKLEVQCVVFFKTVSPVEPVSFVQKICEDAMADPMRKRTRTAKRLAPMSLMGKATMEGLESVAKDVLAPHFHQAPVTPKKFAVRPNMRNHNVMKRDAIIKLIAGLVGQPHKVDLKNYDLLITVEIYQNICGVSVVDHRFEELKRYNISEIFDPTPKEAVKTGSGEVEAKPVEAEAVSKDEPSKDVASPLRQEFTDAMVEGDGGVPLGKDGSDGAGGNSVVNTEVQAESSAGAPQTSDDQAQREESAAAVAVSGAGPAGDSMPASSTTDTT